MKFRDLAVTAAAVVMSSAPAFAQSAVNRAPSPTSDVNLAGGGSTLLLILAIILIGLGVALAAGNKSDKPSSP